MKDRHYYFVFCKDSLLIEQLPDGSFTIPLCEEPPTEVKPWTAILNVTPMDDGTEVKTYAIDTVPADAPTDSLSGQEAGRSQSSMFNVQCSMFLPLRQSYYKLPLPLYLKAGKCAELLYWDHNTRFCGVCGGPMKLHTDISKRCEHCGKEVWPQLATAVIVLIRKGADEVLLARGRSFKTDFYGLIAGFVETGETLEQAVAREVMEETGLSITNIRYFDSQPWPYPCGLMVGFTADYAGGEIHVQRQELSKCAWFHRDHLPRLPEPLSIARRLIDHWVASPH